MFRLIRHFVPQAARFAVLAGTLLLLAGTARAQVSPGSLSRAHSSISGPTQCINCHKLGVGQQGFKCIDCHVEIGRRINEHRGLHWNMVGTDTSPRACVRCHSEHNGENFKIIQWDPSPNVFDHTKTGYPLEGKHLGLACNKCHTPEKILDSERRIIMMKDLKRTFLGLSRDCLGCHQDAHRGQLGKDCASCHTAEDWKKAPRFNHAKAKFPLTGAHINVACEKCHPTTTTPQRFVKFTGLAFSKCVDCHRDPHKGAFVKPCESCHNTVAWKHVSVGGQFDHSKTKFPLLGKHMEVGCTKCHLTSDFKKPLAYQKCSDCHKPDPHNGQFVKRDGGECSTCHTVDGWKPSKFGVKEHSTSAYPLEGKHAKVPCAKCHLPAGKATIYKVKFALCTDCHADAHGKQFAATPYFNKCENCHNLKGYHPSTFTLKRHQATRFELNGAHVAIPCGDCHKQDATRIPAPPITYKFEDRSCSSCHTDPHRGQFRERMTKLRADGTPMGCEGCHTTKSWHELNRFDHSTTSFPLVGAHRGVTCASCHRPPNLERTLKNVDFKAAPKVCESCHQDVHGGQFSTVAGRAPACSGCHTSAKWKPSTFDHDKRTTFPLQGGHKGVACNLCHKQFKEVDGKNVLFYKPTPKECAACHTTTPPPLKPGDKITS